MFCESATLIAKLFAASKFAYKFQAVDCNFDVSYNTITIINQGGPRYVLDKKSGIAISAINSEGSKTLSLSVKLFCLELL